MIIIKSVNTIKLYKNKKRIKNLKKQKHGKYEDGLNSIYTFN